MRRWLSILVVVVCGSLGPAAGHASALKTRLSVQEKCAYRLLPDRGVVLTTNLTMTNARRGRAVSVRFIAGWNVARLYPKAQTEIVVRLGPGQSARRRVTRRMLHAPGLWKALRENGRIDCVSTRVYTIA